MLPSVSGTVRRAREGALFLIARDTPGFPRRAPGRAVLSLSWLERYTDNVEVGSSSLPGTTGFKEIIDMVGTQNEKIKRFY